MSIQVSDIVLIIQTIAIILGVCITISAIKHNKSDNRKMATIDLILRQRDNCELNKATELVAELIKGKDFPSLHEYLDKDKYPDERGRILYLLNYREFVAVGINTGIIDEEIYKRSYYNIILRDYKLLSKTIESIRGSPKGKQTNFQDFEKLVNRWKSEPLKNIK